ncbi:MAG: V-type ATP synthase subunit E [Nitrospiraceae bacterium]
MSYDRLIEALLEEGRNKRDAILHQAQVEAEELLSDARRESEALAREVELTIRRDLSARRAALVARAALSGRRIVLQAKQEILDAVWRHAGEKVRSLAGHARTEVLNALLAEVLAASPSPSPRVFIDDRERPFLEESLKQRGIEVEAQHQDALLLGIKVEGNGEVLTNSFATRLAKAKPALTIELNRLLFGEG